jgi:Fur family ferric uptake transcriptional regulator
LTSAPRAERLSFSSLQDATSELRARGMRLSTARRLLLEALFAADRPVSAESLARGLSTEPASVYRNLETLERHGLVRHVHLGHGPGLYALIGRGEPEYLHCEQCGEVREVAPDELDPVRAEVQRRFGYRTRFTHFALTGLCQDCAEREDTGST